MRKSSSLFVLAIRTALGILYCLPKIHKQDFANFKISRSNFKSSYHQPVHCFKLFQTFKENLWNWKFKKKVHVASFDIGNLFTFIPLEESIKICLLKIFQQKRSVMGLTKELFFNFYNTLLWTLSSYFLVNFTNKLKGFVWDLL